MRIQDEQLKRFILDAGLITKSDISTVEKIAKEENRTLSEALIAHGHMTEDDMRRVESYVLGIPFVALKDLKIDFEILTLIPEPVARTHNIIAYKKSEDTLEVAMLDTADLPAIDFIRKKVGLKIQPRLTDTESMRFALRQYQKTLKDEFGDLIMKDASELKVLSEEGDEVSEKQLKQMAEDLPVVRIVDTLLRHAIIQGASDIHIEPMESEVLVRYRIDGILNDAMKLPKIASDSIVARLKVLSSLKLDQKRLPQDGRFKMEMDGQKVAFRVSILPIFFGEKVVMRLLRENRSGFSLEGIGFHGSTLDRVHRATRATTGIILVTGPTGSGKSTTLYTILDILNTPEVNISTIEDPIEYQMPRVNQSQVKPDIGFTFASGLRSLMRQDPDIIMVGEIRDEETASLAINAALTGHLVLATIHTNSAAGTIARLVDMGAESFLLVSTLRVAVGQRLVRKLSDDKLPYIMTKAEREELGEKVDLDHVLKCLKEESIVKEDATWNDISFYHPKEKGESEDGYKGRMGIHEVLEMSPTLKDMVMDDKTGDEIEAQARKEGMLTMMEDGIFKAAQGLTSVEEVLRVINE
ncbi:Flp pilus assembly complex ATPase component TadA [Candidatus Kaiserbacteria bacterium]|nr:Flp pilus assembly complex ATPase component TadA [Candidatus Kaiserbacteria bacterium]USN92481.1 MAG: Flp pilus assembly complex ATPase component TadA [Candidatus Nomurabacteria bacterium]